MPMATLRGTCAMRCYVGFFMGTVCSSEDLLIPFIIPDQRVGTRTILHSDMISSQQFSVSSKLDP